MMSNWTGKHVDPIYGFLVGMLWLTFVLSGLYTASVLFDWGHSWNRAVDRATGLRSEAALGRRLDEHERNFLADYERQLTAREILPAGTAPAIFLLLVGLLAILRKQHLDTRAVIACIEASRVEPGEETRRK